MRAEINFWGANAYRLPMLSFKFVVTVPAAPIGELLRGPLPRIFGIGRGEGGKTREFAAQHAAQCL